MKTSKHNFLLILGLTAIISFTSACIEEIDTPEDSYENPELSTEVKIYNPDAFYEGYTLYAPLGSTTTYLINMEGNTVHTWESEYTPGNAVYFLDNGSLLRTENTRTNTRFKNTGGIGGRVAKYSFDGELIWSWDYATDEYCLHHDIELLPNGNILMIAWEYLSQEEAIELGKNPDYIDEQGIWPDMIIEVATTGSQGGEIIWEWHQKDHFVQDFDESKPGFRNISQSTERIDINFSERISADFSHINSIEYIEEYDIILLSSRNYSELWMIDHSTSSQEAAGTTGGVRGKGGDLLYRWGNSTAYKSENSSQQQSYYQHNATWIDDLPNNGGNILFFNNGNKQNRSYSSVDEVYFTEDGNGNFYLASSENSTAVWSFTHTDLYSESISGAQRLPNGNTLICEGIDGVFYEVNKEQEIVWQYEVSQEKSACFRATRVAPDHPGLENKKI